jgi:hypothetical protein
VTEISGAVIQLAILVTALAMAVTERIQADRSFLLPEPDGSFLPLRLTLRLLAPPLPAPKENKASVQMA